MALFVNTNVSSLNAQRHLAKSTNSLDTDYRRLSSGLRINSARDDAAGLQISDRLTTQINGLNQGNRNAQDAISMLQTVEGALDEVTNSLQRIRTLAIQSANGTNSAEDRVALQQEVTQLCTEINRISKDTTYGGQKILDGEQAYKVYDVNNVVQNEKIDIYSYDPDKDSKKYYTLYPISQEHPKSTGITLDKDHTSKHFSYQIGPDANETINVNFGLFCDYIKCDAGCGQFFDSKAYLSFDINGLYSTTDATARKASGQGATYKSPEIVKPVAPAEKHTSGFVFLSPTEIGLDVSTPEASQKVIDIVGNFISLIDGKRSELGAVENRLESSIRNSQNVSENVSSARAAIRDTDFAEATAKMVQDNIINQASSSILSQANNLPNLALSLLNN